MALVMPTRLENLKFMQLLGYEPYWPRPLKRSTCMATRMIRHSLHASPLHLLRHGTRKIAYFKLNTQTPCPPPGACPRRTNWHKESGMDATA